MKTQLTSIRFRSGYPRRLLAPQKMISLTVLLSLILMTWTVGLAGAAAPLPQDEGTVYTVQAADWLSKLAEKYFGDPGAWPAI